MDKIRVALFGFEHPHAAALLRSFAAFPEDFEVLGVADVPPFDDQTPENRKKNLGSRRNDYPEFADYRALLELKPELCAVTSDNAARADISCEILERGIPVLGEKPMAMTYQDAKRMAQTAAGHHTTALVNWPIAWFPAFRRAKELADAGRVGRVLRVVYRSPATWGPYSYSADGSLPPDEELAKTWWYRSGRGGGSVYDYACYGTVLSTWIFGHRALRVSAVTKQFTTAAMDVEDYSAMLLDFGEGVGLLEGSWSTFNPAEIPSGPVIYGTDGVIVCDRHSNQVKVYSGRSHTPVPPAEIIETQPEGADRQLGRCLIDFMRGSGPVNEMLDADLNVSVAAVLEAGLKAARGSGSEDVPQE